MENIYRIIDANINRAVEGIRVVEDFFRFSLSEQQLFNNFRELRHKIRNAIQLFPNDSKLLLASRNSIEDVGSAALPKKKHTIQQTISANLHRAQEALRVLEEYSKLISSETSASFAECRFQLYELEKQAFAILANIDFPDNTTQKRLPQKPFIYAIGDCDKLFLSDNGIFLKQLINTGVGIIQLREKNYSAKKVLDVSSKIVSHTKSIRTLFFINDYLDIALLSNSDGLHIGQEDIPIRQGRKLSDNKIIIGISTHSIEEAIQAEKEGADYIAFGPIFETKTKKNLPFPKGLYMLEKIVSAIKIPVVAIGGINTSNFNDVFSAGAAGAAMLSGLDEWVKKQ